MYSQENPVEWSFCRLVASTIWRYIYSEALNPVMGEQQLKALQETTLVTDYFYFFIDKC